MTSWSQGRWANWQNSQTASWTPQKVEKQRALKEDVDARTSSIISGLPGVVPAMIQPQKPAQSTTLQSTRIAERKAAAEKIRMCLALRKTVTSQASLRAIDAELAEARVIANSGKASPTQIKEAAAAVAESQIRLEKASAHLSTAKEHERRATADLHEAQAELERLQATVAPAPAQQSITEDLETMAATLTSLSTSATFTPQGMAIVDPTILQRLVTQLQKTAAPQ